MEKSQKFLSMSFDKQKAKGLHNNCMENALYEERIRGRTEAMEWMYQLVKDYKNIAKKWEKKYPRDAYIYEECADMLETHIEDFARTK